MNEKSEIPSKCDRMLFTLTTATDESKHVAADFERFYHRTCVTIFGRLKIFGYYFPDSIRSGYRVYPFRNRPEDSEHQPKRTSKYRKVR